MKRFALIVLIAGLLDPIGLASFRESSELAFAKPPDWAPAHGYRRKHKDGDDDDKDKKEDWRERYEEDLEERFPHYRLFARSDENNDGRISRREWTESDDLFDRLDRNNDGYLSRAEYERIDEERGMVGNWVAKLKDGVVGLWNWLF